MANIFDRQIMRGMFIGVLVGIILVSVAQASGIRISLMGGIFWGAVVGGFVAYWPRFAKLGAVITRKPAERRRNMIIGVFSLFVFAAVIMALVVGGGWLLTQCFPDIE